MKNVVYRYELIQRAVASLNSLEIGGIKNARAIAEIANIIDSGEIIDEPEKKKKEEKDDDTV